MRIGRYWRLPLAGGHLDASGERQNDEERDEQRMRVHSAAIGSIRLGLLFLTLPTCGLTGQYLISSVRGEGASNLLHGTILVYRGGRAHASSFHGVGTTAAGHAAKSDTCAEPAREYGPNVAGSRASG